jgi:hypothetical protein
MEDWLAVTLASSADAVAPSTALQALHVALNGKDVIQAA